MIRSTFALAALLVALAAPPAGALDLAPHRAIYDLTLLSARSGVDFTDLSGKMYLDWADVCDGWTLNQRVRMTFTRREGGAVDNDFSFSSWESRDGARFRYTMRTTTDGKLVDQVDGRAELDADRQGGVAHFTLPAPSDMPLPAGTLFPTEHLFLIIEHALAGDKVVIKDLFSGTGTDSLNQVSAFIGPVIPAGTKLPVGAGGGVGDEFAALRSLRAWPVAMAYFPFEGNDSEPEFEVHLRLMENGVAPRMDLDYGDFAIRARIDHLELHPPPDC